MNLQQAATYLLLFNYTYMSLVEYIFSFLLFYSDTARIKLE